MVYGSDEDEATWSRPARLGDLHRRAACWYVLTGVCRYRGPDLEDIVRDENNIKNKIF